MVDIETGEVFDNVKYIRIAESDKAYEMMKSKKLFNKSNENFIFLTYKMLKEININKEIFKKEDITKIIYIASFMNYDCKLMLTERTPMTKTILKKKIGISNDRFDKFYKKLIVNKVLAEKNGYIYFNDKIAFRGKPSDRSDNFTRIYRDNIQKIYENIDIREHKKLSILFLMIPYLNLKYNIICKNPYETNEDLVEPLTLGEMAELFGITERSFITSIKYLKSVRDINGNPLIAEISICPEISKNVFIINPRFIYAGNNVKDVVGICPMFNLATVK